MKDVETKNSETDKRPTSRPERQSKSSPREGLRPPLEAGRMKVEGTRQSVSRDAWENPGTFAVQKDDKGRTTRIEGCLELRTEKRGSGDSRLQTESVRATPSKENVSWEGGHLIAQSLGGPTLESYGIALAAGNLVAMEARINKSYIAQLEAHIRDRMKENPGRKLLMQAEVKYGHDGCPKNVTHRIFEANAGGKPDGRTMYEASTRVDNEVSKTQAKAVGDATGEAGKAFYKPGPGGTTGGVN